MQTQMLLSPNPSIPPSLAPNPTSPKPLLPPLSLQPINPHKGIHHKLSHSFIAFSSNHHNQMRTSPPLRDLNSEFRTSDLDQYADVGNKMADAAGLIIRKYFRKTFDILHKDDESPVTIADKEAEEAMVKVIQENFPSHAIFGEENGWRCKEKSADYVWVLDPIDGTKSFITGKPLFGTLISLLYKGKPILGIIDQPILGERWIGLKGRRTALNGQEVSTRSCAELAQAYMYTTSPHLFIGEAELAFTRVRSKVKVPLYGCDCYAYALLATGFVDLVVESGLKPYDFLSLIPVIEGAGGVITDWRGDELHWEASADSQAPSFNVVAAGDKLVHQQAIIDLQWE